MKSNSLAWHYSLKRRLTFDPFSLKGQCFTTYSVLSFILLPKYTIPPFAQLQACIFIFGFLKMTERPEVIAFMINSGCSFWLSEKLPKGKGPFPISVYSTWVFFPFFSDMKKKKHKEAWGSNTATFHQIQYLSDERAILILYLKLVFQWALVVNTEWQEMAAGWLMPWLMPALKIQWAWFLSKDIWRM